MKKRFVIVITIGLCLAFSAPIMAASRSAWTEDFDAAKARAALEKKDMLLNFSGSDWCGWCIKLEQEVFGRAEFKKAAEKKFVLVRLDFPQKSKPPERIRQQNQRLAKVYGIEGFPTVVVTDAEGRLYARTGYRPGGPEKYLAHLDRLRENRMRHDRLMARAQQSRRLEKARLLDEALEVMGKNQVGPDPDVVAQIKRLDSKNLAGLRSKYEVREGLMRIMEEIGRTKDFDKALRDLDRLVASANPPPDIRQDVYYIKAGIYYQGKKDRKAGLETLKKAWQISPDTEKGKKLAEIIRHLETGK